LYSFAFIRAKSQGEKWKSKYSQQFTCGCFVPRSNELRSSSAAHSDNDDNNDDNSDNTYTATAAAAAAAATLL
jgi:hypothetical protein